MAEQLLGIRKWLNDQGYGDNDIGYNNGNVTLKGQNLLSATPQAQDNLNQGLYKDSTYATGSALQNALSNYQNTYGKPQLTNTNKASTLGDTIYNNATSKPFEFKQPEAFNYNPQSDVQYQNALQSALANAQVASNNAQSQLGARGIGNSSIASNMANQIQQKAVGDVTTSVLPQLIQQAYARYQDQVNNDYRTQAANYGAQQDQLRNQSSLANYFNGLDQQDFSNQRALNQEALQNRQANLGALQTAGALTGQIPLDGPKADWSLLFPGENATQFTPTLSGQQFQNTVAQQGIENQRADRQLNASLANMSSDNARAAAAEARAAGNQQLGALFDIWDRTGVAPAGIPGVQAGTPLRDRTAAPKTTDYKSDPNFADDVAFLKNNPNEASKLDTHAQEFINQYGYDGYLALRKAAGIDKQDQSDVSAILNGR